MPEMPQSEIDALGAFRFLANQFGGSPQAVLDKINKLHEDNKEYRTEIKSLKELLPKDGQVVVAKVDAELLETYKGLGEVAVIKGKLEAGEKAMGQLAEVELRATAKAFAEATGLADEAVDTLIAIPALAGAKFETRKVTETVNGKKVEKSQGFLTLADSKDSLDFSAAQEKVPALKGLAKRESDGTKQSGVTFTSETSGAGGSGGAGGRSIFDQIRNEVAGKPAVETPTQVKVPNLAERLGMNL